jgi:hypothetical protein
MCWPIKINYFRTLLQLLIGPRLSVQVFAAGIVDSVTPCSVMR